MAFSTDVLFTVRVPLDLNNRVRGYCLSFLQQIDIKFLQMAKINKMAGLFRFFTPVKCTKNINKSNYVCKICLAIDYENYFFLREVFEV